MPQRTPKTHDTPALVQQAALEARWRRGDVVVERPRPSSDEPRPAPRLRAVCAYDRLHARGGLSDPQREAADRYALLREAELGARWNPSGPPAVRTPRHAGSGHPILSQLQAAAALRRVHELVGQQARVVVTLLVVDNMPVKAIAERLGIGPDVAMGLVLAVLTRLAEHWGMAG